MELVPFEPEFHAEFENEGSRAWFLDFNVVFNDFHVEKANKKGLAGWPAGRFFLLFFLMNIIKNDMKIKE